MEEISHFSLHQPLYSFVSLIVYIIAVVAYKRKAAYFTINTHKTGLNASTGHRYNQKFAPDFPPQIPVLATLVYWGVAPATPALFTPTFPERAGLLASKTVKNYRRCLFIINAKIL